MKNKTAGILAAIAVPAFLLTGCTPSTGVANSTATPTKAAAQLITCPDLFGPEDTMVLSAKNKVTIAFDNQTEWPMTVGTSEIDCYDFSGAANPSLIDGTVVQPGQASAPIEMVVGRVCPWIDGDIIGKFQERQARWATNVNFEGAGDFNLRTAIECGSLYRQPTMCEGGTSQNKDDYLLDLGDHLLRITSTCDHSKFNITVKTEI